MGFVFRGLIFGAFRAYGFLRAWGSRVDKAPGLRGLSVWRVKDADST